MRFRGVGLGVALRVHVPSNWILRALVLVIIVPVLGKYMIIRYLDPKGNDASPWRHGSCSYMVNTWAQKQTSGKPPLRV